jgi:hypothetical protein
MKIIHFRILGCLTSLTTIAMGYFLAWLDWNYSIYDAFWVFPTGLLSLALFATLFCLSATYFIIPQKDPNHKDHNKPTFPLT